MAQHLENVETVSAGIGAGNELVSLLGGLFGTSSTSQIDLSKLVEGSGVTKEYTNLSPEALDRIIQQVLGGVDGISSIFGAEQSAGLYNSSVAAQASGDLIAQLVGEIAKLTAPKVTEFVNSESTKQSTKQTDKKKGLLEGTLVGGTLDVLESALTGPTKKKKRSAGSRLTNVVNYAGDLIRGDA